MNDFINSRAYYCIVFSMLIVTATILYLFIKDI